MYATAAGVKELDYYTRLGREFKSDLAWWHTFLVSWNGLNLLRSVSCSTSADFVIQTDTSGTWGCGAFFNMSWFQWQVAFELGLSVHNGKGACTSSTQLYSLGTCLSKTQSPVSV